jgi:hypothetical protein
MLDAMTVRGLAQRTQECYSGAIARMALHYHRSPDLLSAAEIEAYLLYLVKDRKLSYSSVNHVASASRFLFETVLLRKGDCVRPPMARVPQRQPHLLSRHTFRTSNSAIDPNFRRSGRRCQGLPM